MQNKFTIGSLAIVFSALLVSCSGYWKGDYTLKEKLTLRKAQVSANEEDYASAAQFYKAVFNEHKSDAYLNYKMGECQLLQGEVSEALTYFELAEAKSEGLEPMYTFRYGQALQKIGSYKKAAEMYEKFKSSASKSDLKYTNVQMYANQVQFAIKAVDKPMNAQVVNAGAAINSVYSDGIPSLTADGKTLIFTSARPDGMGAKAEAGAEYFQDIYGSNWNTASKSWLSAKMLEGGINTAGHDANTAIAPDGSSIFVYRNIQDGAEKTGSGDIFVSAKDESGSWSIGKQVTTINSDYFETGACVSADGKKVFFVSERNDVMHKNYGNTDVFMIEMQTDGSWSAPTNIGPVVNTPQDEISIFVHPDSKTLFFASSGHDDNMGGYDIFKTVYENGVWSKPVNLGYPINTFRDERHFVLAANGLSAFYATQLDAARKDLDIYQINLANYNVVTGVSRNSIVVKGLVKDAESGVGLPADVFVRNLDSAHVTRFTANEKGEFVYHVVGGQKYKLQAVIPGYNVYEGDIDAPMEQNLQAEMAYLASLQRDPEVKMNSVPVSEQEVFSEAHLTFVSAMDSIRFTAASKKAMAENIERLKKDTFLKVKITGNYFDPKESAEICMGESFKLVDYVRTMLLAQGIAFDRIDINAAGNTHPLTSDLKSKEGRAENTRIDMQIEY